DASGARLGQLIQPLDRIGVYVPGGRAAYPSTVLMTAVPARGAGVREGLAVSPAGAGGPPPGLPAARPRAGGAPAPPPRPGPHAPPTTRRVDKIVGPGNVYVATAKRLVYGQVDIDSIAGPSEVLIVADGSASAGVIAADMLAQAEHDPQAAAICVTADRRLA